MQKKNPHNPTTKCHVKYFICIFTNILRYKLGTAFLVHIMRKTKPFIYIQQLFRWYRKAANSLYEKLIIHLNKLQMKPTLNTLTLKNMLQRL